MRIFHRKKTDLNKKIILKELQDLADAKPALNPVCGPHCDKYSETECNRNCQDAPVMLSSDLDKYPLDKKIAPLVYEFKRLGFYTPCWSCEGHLDQMGKIWKIPRVWFYASKVSHIRVLGEAIKIMSFQGHLNADWEIKVIPSEENNFDTRFSLQPVIDDTIDSLTIIQKDIDIIAENLFDSVLKQAKKLILSLDLM